MEFLVTMTTHVPAGTLDETVAEVRSREAAHSRELAAQGHLIRLWRPARQPGEWRTLGLFAADDADDLEKLLAAMPLHIWRTDEVTPLQPHPNDPAFVGIVPNHSQPNEFLIVMAITVPECTPAHVVEDTTAREAKRARELAGQGHLVRLWALPGKPGCRRTLGLWRAHDAANMVAILESLPLYGWMTVGTTPLTAHPNDPESPH
jgi:muconolactone delta-isomerase